MSPANRLPPSLDDLLPHLEHEARVWLVGGAVRDGFLQRAGPDLDFAAAHGALALARRAADRLGGAYYPLDRARGTGRVVLLDPDGGRRTLDFADLRGPDIEADLRARDFTVNALAIPLDQPERLIDPTGGVQDLRARRLRACAPDSVQRDPVRALRAIRLAAELDLHLEPETIAQVRAGAPRLADVAAERVRDELFRALELPRAAGALRAMERLGVLQAVFPEAVASRGQGPAGWDLALGTVEGLGVLLAALGAEHDREAAGNQALALAGLRLGRFRGALSAALAIPPGEGRPRRALLALIALLQELGGAGPVPASQAEQAAGAADGASDASRVAARAQALRLSGVEIGRVRLAVQHRNRPATLEEPGALDARAVYRFFRDLGPAALEVILLSLARLLAAHPGPVPQAAWEARLGVARRLLEAKFEGPPEALDPPRLVPGDELAEAVGVPAGPALGRLLEAIREAQAAGEVTDRAGAITRARAILARGDVAPG